MISTLRLLALTLCVAASLQAQQERILSFHSDISIDTSGALLVRETIQVFATGSAIQRGIYRSFPTLYRGAAGLRLSVPFDVVSIQRDGHPEPFSNERISNGRRLRIGQKEVLLEPGEHTYEITYRTSEQIGRFDQHDELYWNVTGNGWDFVIEKASARITLPGSTKSLSHEAYTGPQGAKGTNYRSSETAPGVVLFETTSPLPPHHGLTVVVTWPKGILDPAPPRNLGLRYVRDNWGIVGAVIGIICLLVYYVMTWFAIGKDPAKGTIIPRFEPPKDFSPAAVRYLQRMGFDEGAFTAAIISLASEGALTIVKNDELFTLQATGKSESSGLAPEERKLYDALFSGRCTLVLQQSNHQILSVAKQALSSALGLALEKQYFFRNTKYWLIGLLIGIVPLAVSLLNAEIQPGVALLVVIWLGVWSMAVAAIISTAVSQIKAGRFSQGCVLGMIAIPFSFGSIAGLMILATAAGIPAAVIFLLTVVAHAAFFHYLKRPTLLGRQTLDEIEGFHEYLSVAEEERLNLLNPPGRTPELFERFLPYAFALNCEQQWSRAFDAILAQAAQEPGQRGTTYRPAWYSGDTGAFSASSFSDQLSSSFAGAVSSASTAPGTSSGSSGGGSSGGGGGGGGGGGW